MTRESTPQAASNCPIPGTKASLLWAADLSIERRDQLLALAAEWVVRKGLEAPAVMFLEMHKPLTTMAAVGYAFAQPPLMMLFGFQRTEEVRLLLSDRANIELLMDRIEQRSAARRAPQKKLVTNRGSSKSTGEGGR